MVSFNLVVKTKFCTRVMKLGNINPLLSPKNWINVAKQEIDKRKSN